MALDFSVLTDEQLVDLLRGAMQEAISRGNSTEASAREVMLSEKQRIEIARAAADKERGRLAQEEAAQVARAAAEHVRNQAAYAAQKTEAAKQQKLWAKRAEHSKALLTLLGDLDIWVNVWNNGEKRVYLNKGNAWRSPEICCLYITGNSDHAPGSITGLKRYWSEDSGLSFEEFKAQVSAILNDIGAFWKVVKFSTQQASEYVQPTI